MASSRLPTSNPTGAPRRRRPFTGLPWFVRPFDDGAVVQREAAPIAIEEGASRLLAVERRERAYRRALGLADVVALALCVPLVITVVGNDRLKPTSLLALGLIVCVAKLQGLYDRDDLVLRKSTVDEAPRLFQLATLTTLVFWLGESMFIEGRLGSAEVFALWAALSVLLVGTRWLARALVRHVVEAERCVLVGDRDVFERLRVKLDAGSGVAAQLVGRMSVRTLAGEDASASHEAGLRELIASTQAHRLIIDPQVLPPAEMLDFVRAAKSAGVRVSLLPRVLDVVGSSVVFDDLQGITVLGVRRFGLTRSSRIVKRTFDVVGAGLALLVLAPLVALVAVLVKLDSPGPVLFRQTRIGRDDKPFQITKFRTMVVDAEDRKTTLRAHNEAAEGLFKIADDPRITRLGHFLRRTSIDELPQLINVLRGDMSLVGPRPLVVDEDAQITGWDRRRLQLTPGITGQWQLAGGSRVPLQEMVKIDYVYVAGWSLWSDVKILLRTVPYVLNRRGL